MNLLHGEEVGHSDMLIRELPTKVNQMDKNQKLEKNSPAREAFLVQSY